MGQKRKLSSASLDEHVSSKKDGSARKDKAVAGYAGFDVSWPVPSRDHEFQDLYKKPPDFKQLALLDSDFAAL